MRYAPTLPAGGFRTNKTMPDTPWFPHVYPAFFVGGRSCMYPANFAGVRRRPRPNFAGGRSRPGILR